MVKFFSFLAAPQFVLPTDDPTDETESTASVTSEKEDTEQRPQRDERLVFDEAEDF